MTAESVRTFWDVVALVAIGWLVLMPFFRRVGGEGGGAEKAIVGFIWVLAAVSLGFFMFHGAGGAAAG